MRILQWAYFFLIQLVSLVAMVIGWIVLIPFCLVQAWTSDAVSIKDGRQIDRWSWRPLNAIFGNPEDGVSGQTALIWVNGVPSTYLPNAWAPWRAYCWSGWRNSCDGLKYAFALESGPYVELAVFGHILKLGWQRENGIKVPVL